MVSHQDVPDRPVDAALRALANNARLTPAATSISERASSYSAHLREAKQSQVLPGGLHGDDAAEAAVTHTDQSGFPGHTSHPIMDFVRLTAVTGPRGKA